VTGPTGNRFDGGRSCPDPNSVGLADTKRLIALLDSQPITKGLKVWATEFGWETNPPDKGSQAISTAKQALWIPEAFDYLERTKRVTVGISYVLTDPDALYDFQSGTYTSSGKKKPSFFAFQRMISSDVMSVKRGGAVNLWAKSNINHTKTVLQYSANGKYGWRTLPSKRAADGSIRRVLRMTKTLCFATYDGVMTEDGTVRGPSRCVKVVR